MGFDAERRPTSRPYDTSYALSMGNIDWKLAQRIAEMVAGTPAGGGVSPSSAPRTGDYAAEIVSYTGLSAGGLPAVELVDRPRWIAANLRSMRPLLEPLSDRAVGGLGPLSGLARSATGLLLGAQVGALTGMLSQRVLGQYDLTLLDPSVEPRLLLLSPNLSSAARTLRVDEGELVAWVTIHEVTHAIQFGASPWLRDHLGGILTQLMDSMSVNVSTDSGLKLSDLAALRDLGAMRDELSELLARARRGELLRMTLGEDRWRLVDRMQATMSLIEGHAEHVMDVVGRQQLPSLPKLRAALNRRRASRPVLWRVLERLLGLELKMRQYEVGRAFCDSVVEAGGPSALTMAFASAESLPTTAELEAPGLWLARVAA